MLLSTTLAGSSSFQSTCILLSCSTAYLSPLQGLHFAASLSRASAAAPLLYRIRHDTFLLVRNLWQIEHTQRTAVLSLYRVHHDALKPQKSPAQCVGIVILVSTIEFASTRNMEYASTFNVQTSNDLVRPYPVAFEGSLVSAGARVSS